MIIKKFILQFPVKLGYTQREDAKTELNLHHLGHKQVNELVGGRYVDRFPDHPNRSALEDAHFSVHMDYSFTGEFSMDENGHLHFERLVTEEYK